MADANDARRGVHPGPLDVVNALVHVQAGAVELGRVHVHDEGLAAAERDGDAGGIRHPVVRVHEIELLAAREAACKHRVALYLGKELAAVVIRSAGAYAVGERRLGRRLAVRGVWNGGAARCAACSDPCASARAEILGAGIGVQGHRQGSEAGVAEERLRIDELVGFVVLGLVGQVGRGDDAHMGRAGGFHGARQNEEHLDAVVIEAARETVTCGAEAAADEGRELPAEHEDLHGCLANPFAWR